MMEGGVCANVPSSVVTSEKKTGCQQNSKLHGEPT